MPVNTHIEDFHWTRGISPLVDFYIDDDIDLGSYQNSKQNRDSLKTRYPADKGFRRTWNKENKELYRQLVKENYLNPDRYIEIRDE